MVNEQNVFTSNCHTFECSNKQKMCSESTNANVFTSNCHTFECSNKQKMCSESTNAEEPVDIGIHYNYAWEAFGGCIALKLQWSTSKMYLLQITIHLNAQINKKCSESTNAKEPVDIDMHYNYECEAFGSCNVATVNEQNVFTSNCHTFECSNKQKMCSESTNAKEPVDIVAMVNDQDVFTSNYHTFECLNKQRMCSESTNGKEPVDIDMHYNYECEAFRVATVNEQNVFTSNCHTFEYSNKQKMCSESTNAKEPVDIDMHYNNAWEAFGGRTVL
ncbi:hypothetical protein GJ496_002336 [Pomphorhynchus laevis]|nr:hypothetical protein GJ496_002336 [Pomphorhynchus laevis]